MRTRPWPVVVLAFFQILAPLVNILLSAFLMKMSAAEFVSAIFHQATWYQIFDFFVLPPLAGVTVYIFRTWSYCLFLGITAWNILENINVWYQNPEAISLPIMLGVHAANLGLVSYFLIPAVRAAYFRPELRWWETAPRFYIDIAARILNSDGTTHAKISDISEGGAFVRTSSKFEPDENIQIAFSFMNTDVSLEARVVHARMGGYGLQFHLNPHTEAELGKIIKVLRLMKYPQRAPKTGFLPGFRSWLGRLVTTGEGLVPEVPKQDSPKKKKDDDQAA